MDRPFCCIDVTEVILEAKTLFNGCVYEVVIGDGNSLKVVFVQTSLMEKAEKSFIV